MKTKSLILSVFLLMSISGLNTGKVEAQQLYMEMDGVDWQRMTEREKLLFVQGFVLGTENFMMRAVSDYGDTIEPAEFLRLMTQTHYFWHIWPEDVVQHVETFYMTEDNLDVELYHAVYSGNKEPAE